MENTNAEFFFENSIFKASLYDGSFFLLEVKDDVQVGLDSAIEYMAFNECLAEQHGNPVPVLTYSKGLISVDKQARRYIHGYKDSTAYLANAIVVERLASRAMMSFIMKLIPSSKFPELVFDSIANARFWLEQEMRKSNWNLYKFGANEFSAPLTEKIHSFVAKERQAHGLSPSLTDQVVAFR